MEESLRPHRINIANTSLVCPDGLPPEVIEILTSPRDLTSLNKYTAATNIYSALCYLDLAFVKDPYHVPTADEVHLLWDIITRNLIIISS